MEGNDAFLLLEDIKWTQRIFRISKDKKGEMLIDWMSKYGVILLNGDKNCTRLYTWERNYKESVIHYILVNDIIQTVLGDGNKGRYINN